MRFESAKGRLVPDVRSLPGRWARRLATASVLLAGLAVSAFGHELQYGAYARSSTDRAVFVQLTIHPGQTATYSVSANADVTQVQLGRSDATAGSRDLSVGTGTFEASDSFVGALQYNPTQIPVEVRFADGSTATAALMHAAYLPVLGRVEGAGGTRFTTRISVVNRTGVPMEEMRLMFFRSGMPEPFPEVRPLGTLAPKAGVLVEPFTSEENIVGGGVVLTSKAAAVRAEIVETRISAGEAGFAYPPQTPWPAGEMLLRHAATDEIQSGVGKRANIGVFNPHAAEMHIRLRARRASDGEFLGSSILALAPHEHRQFSAADLFGSNVQGTTFILSVVGGGRVPPWPYVYASLIDNATGDASFVSDRQ